MAEYGDLGDLDRAANCMVAWLWEHLDVATCEALSEVDGHVFLEAAECAIRAARGEFDTRPMTMIPHLPR